MISFCYTEDCYRTFILDYFGDRSHDGTCGTCGNCLQRARRGGSESTGFSSGNNLPPIAPARDIDRFIMKHAPSSIDLEEELAGQSRMRRKRERAESTSDFAPDDADSSIAVAEPRELSDEEKLTVRKILACAT